MKNPTYITNFIYWISSIEMLVQCTFVGIGSFWKLNWQPMCDLGRLPHNILAAILPASDAGLYTKVHLLF